MAKLNPTDLPWMHAPLPVARRPLQHVPTAELLEVGRKMADQWESAGGQVWPAFYGCMSAGVAELHRRGLELGGGQ